MTDLTKLRDDVIEAAKGYEPASRPCSDIYIHRQSHDRLMFALAALRAAEEAAKKPRLRRAVECSADAYESHATNVTINAVLSRDSEWMAAIRKLAQEMASLASTVGKPSEPAIVEAVALSDIEALAESAR